MNRLELKADAQYSARSSSSYLYGHSEQSAYDFMPSQHEQAHYIQPMDAASSFHPHQYHTVQIQAPLEDMSEPIDIPINPDWQIQSIATNACSESTWTNGSALTTNQNANQQANHIQDTNEYNLIVPSESSTGIGSHQIETPHEKIIQRVKANKKERRRTQSINQAFSELRRHIPDVPIDTKLSKIKTLRLAISYISHLMATLNGDQTRAESRQPIIQKNPPASSLNVYQQAKSSSQTVQLGTLNESHLNHTTIVHLSQTGAGERSRNKDRKHRTGWPEIVWKSSSGSLKRLDATRK